MTPRSIRRAQERKALKLARKAEKTALQSGGAHPPEPQSSATHAPAAFSASEARPLAAKLAATSLPSQRVSEPSPEILQEFPPELIAAANAESDRIRRQARIRLQSKPHAQPAAQAAAPAEKGRSEELCFAETSSISPAQLRANRANAQLSTGPTSTEGRAISCRNNFRYGFTGAFVILESEDEAEYQGLLDSLRDEHQAATPTEHLLVQKMAQHYWLSQRAVLLQGVLIQSELSADEQAKRLTLFLRYQTTNDRGFHKCLNDLLKLKAERRKAQIGFESQKRNEADQSRRQARENRQQERHKWAVLTDQAKIDHQTLLNLQLPGSEQFTGKAIQRIIAAEKAAA